MIEQGGRGGVADYTAQLTRALAAQGWQIALATADDHRYEPASEVTIHGIFHYLRGETHSGAPCAASGSGASPTAFASSSPSRGSFAWRATRM